ncbi:SMI1/KNR4 family protein [Lampropedia aestuarii]|uniref:SMI1/KNR4 family protein n=1 Tax=Lampropedia aestuarii TaxID=2562762 RepID=A0A4S5BLW6_9BURK|nr:SMI1/KNR4 family protein [Lampropedia aestuarii]THJ30476.1 SMI1/KNR4 family protein [Lampropedia aestuarii]
MIERDELMKRFQINNPARSSEVDDVSSKIFIPNDYLSFLRVSNGLSSLGRISLLEVEDLFERNVDYEVGEYLPGYLMIGDDGGGVAILMDKHGLIFENDMGTMMQETMVKSAESLEQLLIDFNGLTVSER